jgi:hypothetical protein
MKDLLARRVKAEEATRLGVQSGWYGTKVSGTFVTGPHASNKDCLREIARLDPSLATDRHRSGTKAHDK